MPFIGNKPSAVPLTSADITDSIITSAKIVDGTIVNADINASAAIDSTKLTGVGATAGQVINVYTATDSTLRSSNSQTFTTASSTLSITMTPTSSSNKVLLMVYTKVQCNGNYITFSFFRDSTNLAGASNACFASAYNTGGTDVGTEHLSFNYLDSPATASSITYSLRFRSNDNNTSKFNFQPDVTQVATIMALEIKG
jgi:hypothetical protein